MINKFIFSYKFINTFRIICLKFEETYFGFKNRFRLYVMHSEKEFSKLLNEIKIQIKSCFPFQKLKIVQFKTCNKV